MTTYTLEALRDSLEVALEDRLGGKSLAKFYCGGRSSSQSRGEVPKRGWSGDHWAPDMPDAERELHRDLDALRRISADCPRDRWRSIVVAIADRHLGSDFGREIALAWSLGGRVADAVFPEPTGDYTIDDFEACWRDACRRPRFSIGTVFLFAKEAGWNSSRGRWGLGRVQRPGKMLSANALRVQAAGLLMPREKPYLERVAWCWQVRRATRRPDLCDVAFVIAFSINAGSGFAWRSLAEISGLLSWPRGRKGDGFQRASRAVRDLARLGFIVRSPGNERGAHGRIGPSFALTLPDAMTWEACIAAYRTAFGSSPVRPRDQPGMAATGTAQDGSKPKEKAQTHTKSDGSQPNSNGRDRHQISPVQTTPTSDQHQDNPVHLNVEGVAGRRGAQGEPARSRSSTAHSTSPVDAVGVPSDQTPQPVRAPIEADAQGPADAWTPESFWGPPKSTSGDRS
jgi:hypothetical protein